MCPKQDKILIALFVSIYIFEVFFENVPIWQLYAGNFTPVQYQHLQPSCQTDILLRAFRVKECETNYIFNTTLKGVSGRKEIRDRYFDFACGT